jgi:EXLDI family protein
VASVPTGANREQGAEVPNKTIYVSDDDLPLYQRAQALAGGSLSAAIGTALRRYVDLEDDRQDGYDEIIVRVGVGVGRKQRFSGVLLGEWGRSAGGKAEVFRIYRTRSGRFAMHVERSADRSDASDNWVRDLANWRTMLGVGERSWSVVPSESVLEVADTLEELRERMPAELYEVVTALAQQPAVEDLDI